MACIRLLILCGAMLATPVVASGDHHMHIHSQAGAEVWVAMCVAMESDCAYDEVTPFYNVEDLIRALDESQIDKAAVLSSAYFFGVPELAGSRFDKISSARAENAYVAEQVARYPNRLAGFMSINPLSGYALDEVRYWAERGGLSGLKLHLANSDLDLLNPDHIAQLRAVFDILNEHRLSVILHLRNRDPDYGYEHARRFIEKIARDMPDVTIQLAHLAGWGGFDAGTGAAIQAFLDAIERGDLQRANIWFDMAAVVDEDMPPDTLTALEQAITNIGYDRILFATDWDYIEPQAYRTLLREKLSFPEAAWQQIMNNEAPYTTD